MAGKILHLLCGAMLLAQCSRCVENQAAESKAPEVTYEEATPRMQLHISAMIGYAPLAKMTMLNGTVVIRELLEETAGLKNASEALKSQLAKLTAFERSTYKLLRWIYPDEEMVGVAFALTTQMSELVAKYNATLEQSSSSEDLLLKRLLLKHDFEPLAQGFSEHFTRFQPKFSAEVEKFFAVLSPEERVKESAMLEWFRQFQGESNFRNFVKFFDLYPVRAALTVQKYKMWRDAVM